MSGCSSPVFKVVLHIAGIVQGVGFRPTVYRYALEERLGGHVLNDSNGVFVTLVGSAGAIERFAQRLLEQPPPLAKIESFEELTREEVQECGDAEFSIARSVGGSERTTLISADMATCDDCVSEMFSREDRRYGYPFLNCTNCGPRYTIIEDIPYDRPLTTMKQFGLCAACRAEYEDPLDRRFHAQPTCCPECGPRLSLLDASGQVVQSEALVPHVLAALARGYIVAVKGLGGFHLACDARSGEAVARLRRRKRRDEKPFAVMASSLDVLSGFACLNEVEKRLVVSRERPIVLLKKRKSFGLASQIAPGNRWIGVMLPYTPLHHLLLSGASDVLVMTSANLSDEPIVKANDEAVDRLAGIADLFVVHDRRILTRVDDSVMRVANGRALHLRRSRGFVPVPIDMGRAVPSVLAMGGELKSTVCITRGRHAFVSQHIGDLEDERSWDFYLETVDHMRKVLDVTPGTVVYDLHPEYLSTKHALEMPGVSRVGVQHHHAHVLSCMAEHRLREPVIGLALDGTGWGPDGTVWGGEVLAVDGVDCQRLGHFKALPLPGNAMAIREPWRMALSYVHDAFCGSLSGAWESWAPWGGRKEAPALLRLLDQGYGFFASSGAGRLFEAVGALLGVRPVNTFEGQSAMELEMLAVAFAGAEALPFDLVPGEGPFVLDFARCIRELVEGRCSGVAPERLAYLFHVTVARALLAAACRARVLTGTERVILSGGVFQNDLLTSRLVGLLEEHGFQVFTHSLVPPNDGGISLGQAYYATFL